MLAVTPGKNTGIVTTLFTDIEGSALLWEQDSERMRLALARHDAVLRSAVESHRGIVVKMMGDGMHAAFDDPLDAVGAALQLQQALANDFSGCRTSGALRAAPWRGRTPRQRSVRERRQPPANLSPSVDLLR